MKNLLKFSIYRVSFWCLFLLSHLMCLSQTSFFKMQQLPTDIISVEKVFSKNTVLSPFKGQDTIISLGIKAKLSMNSPKSFVRIVLADKNGNEYLIFEGGKSFVDTDTTSLTNYAEETAILNSIIPDLIKIEVYDATIDFSQILISNTAFQKNVSETYIQGKIAFNKRNQDSTKVEKLNKYLKKKGFKWTAKETSLSKLMYEQKKRYFGGTLPNLFGFEFYGGGIFEIPSTIPNLKSASTTSTVVESFDWRSRHGQNNNWLTPIKDQGSCGSCGIFAVTGATEALVNLYYNQHINLNLAEQNAVSCVIGECSSGWMPSDVLNYYTNTEVVDEACFPYMTNSSDDFESSDE